MLLNKSIKEFDSFLDINNDVYRIVKVLNENQELKKLLFYTGKDPSNNPNEVGNLIDKQINRTPIIPDNEEEGSICVITIVKGDVEQSSSTLNVTLAIDVFTPSNQWIINDGIRPLLLSYQVDNTMKNSVNQTGGIKYRLTDFISAKLSDILVGYRLLYEVVIDE